MKKIRISEIENTFWYDKAHCAELKEEAQKTIEYAENSRNEIVLCTLLEGVDGVKREACETVEKALEAGKEKHRRNMGYAHVWIEIRKPGSVAKIHELEKQIEALQVELSELIKYGE